MAKRREKGEWYVLRCEPGVIRDYVHYFAEQEGDGYYGYGPFLTRWPAQAIVDAGNARRKPERGHRSRRESARRTKR